MMCELATCIAAWINYAVLDCKMLSSTETKITTCKIKI